MVRKLLSLIMLSFSLAIGGFWGLRAQDPPAPKPVTVKTEPQATATNTTQVDLSGTYAGTFNCEAAGLVGDTTLTINGNEFTTADGRTGRIVASKTAGYTAVALQVNNSADATAAPTIVSVRAKKIGTKLILSPVAGSMQKCSFAPSRAMAKSRRTRQTPAATGTEVSSPAAVPSAMPAESPMPSQTPSPIPPPSPTPSGSPTPEPAPTATPNPSPGEPTPSPTPSPSPSPSYVR
jgi:hypothetical protein